MQALAAVRADRVAAGIDLATLASALRAAAWAEADDFKKLTDTLQRW